MFIQNKKWFSSNRHLFFLHLLPWQYCLCWKAKFTFKETFFLTGKGRWLLRVIYLAQKIAIYFTECFET